VAGTDASSEQEALDVSKWEREADIQHHYQANDLGAGFEIAKSVAFFRSAAQLAQPTDFNQVVSDKTPVDQGAGACAEKAPFKNWLRVDMPDECLER